MKQEIILKHLVYKDGVIAIALVQSGATTAGLHLALRWLKPASYGKDGKTIPLTNNMGGETGWFIVPYSLAVGIARILTEQRAAGLRGFKTVGFKKMVKWLIGLEGMNDAMSY